MGVSHYCGVRVHEPFEFWYGGRTYHCKVTELDGAAAGKWWSFHLSNPNECAMPFRAEPGDTKASVQERVIAYHTNFLARRAAPPVPHHPAGRPPKAVQQARAAEAAEATAEE